MNGNKKRIIPWLILGVISGAGYFDKQQIGNW